MSKVGATGEPATDDSDGTTTQAPVLWQLLRPGTLILIALQTILCHLLLELPAPPALSALGGLVLLGLWYAHGVAINDLSDVETDAVNLAGATDRPLINKATTRSRLWLIVVGLTAALLIMAAVLSGWLILVVLIMVGLNLSYSLRPIRLSGRGAWAQLLLPIGYVAFPAVIVWAVSGGGPVELRGVIAVSGLYLLLIGRLFLKDIRDVEGDRRTGKRTFVLRVGLARTVQASGLFMIIGVVIMAAAITFDATMRYALLAAGLITVASLPRLLSRLRTERDRDRQVLWVGLIGRMASLWTFCATISLAVTAWSAGPWWHQEVITAMAVLLFVVSTATYTGRLRVATRPG